MLYLLFRVNFIREFHLGRPLRQKGHEVTREVSAVEDLVPRRALVAAPRANNPEVDAVYPVRELTHACRSGGVEERLDRRFISCGLTRLRGDAEPASKKTTDHGDTATRARIEQG